MVQHNQCIGCQACVDFCPKKAISFQYDNWGEGKAFVNLSLCNNCHLCETLCPALNSLFNPAAKNVFAAFSKDHRQTGSSGGVFYELALRFLNKGGVVFGAAFDSNLKLVHKKVSNVSELVSLCKSKYLHSDMHGIYNEIDACVKKNLNVMFVGTPCQVSAVKNTFSKYRDQLLLVDFLCHGTGTQKCFDMCINAEENKRKGRIIDFMFRAKTRKAEHSFKYNILCNDKLKTVTGYSFEFPYYNAYLKYSIFNEVCYTCQFARQERVGDITLGDFWGIQKYDKRLKDTEGVSMLSVNTQIGAMFIEEIRDSCKLYEYPIQTASSGNEAFRKCVSPSCLEKKHELTSVLETQGKNALIQRLACQKVKKEIIYAKTPTFVKKIWNYVRGKS